MKSITWLTDLHLEFLSSSKLQTFCHELAELNTHSLLIGGDTGLAINFTEFLGKIVQAVQCPVYFVLGNHDFYHGAIQEVRSKAAQISQLAPLLRWLPLQRVVKLTEKTCLIGHGSWADGRLGNGSTSDVELSDYFMIEDLTGLSTQQRFKKLGDLGNEAAQYFSEVLPEACTQFENIILLTHVPPFRDACWHQGEISDDDYLPHFACKAAGDVLKDVMSRNPENQLTVLCGHTHSPGLAKILPNLMVKTGGATYGNPCIQELIVVE